MLATTHYSNMIKFIHTFSLPRAETERMLIEARQEQIHHKEHFLAVQAQRDRDEFDRVLRSARRNTALQSDLYNLMVSSTESNRR